MKKILAISDGYNIRGLCQGSQQHRRENYTTHPLRSDLFSAIACQLYYFSSFVNAYGPWCPETTIRLSGASIWKVKLVMSNLVLQDFRDGQ